MIALPNALWVRSPKQPQYAICLDPDAQFFGWKMIENQHYDTWTSVAALTNEEVLKALGYDDFAGHIEQLQKLAALRGISDSEGGEPV